MRGSIPLAIVLAGALIGAGLFFGLRSRPEPAPYGAPGAQAALPLPGPAAPPAPPLDPALVRRNGDAAAVGLKRRMIERCWQPAVAKVPTPATSRYTMDSLFTAEGVEVSRGISEVREVPSRMDVAGCLRSLPLDLRIPPPGGKVRLEFVLEFP